MSGFFNINLFTLIEKLLKSTCKHYTRSGKSEEKLKEKLKENLPLN